MAATRIEDLIAWQKARLVTREVYRVTRQEQVRADFGLSGQMQRAAVSVMANIAEGFARRGATEFRRYLDIAFGSSVELQSHLYVALDVGYLAESEFRRLYNDTDEVGRLILGLKRSTAPERDVRVLPARPASMPRGMS